MNTETLKSNGLPEGHVLICYGARCVGSHWQAWVSEDGRESPVGRCGGSRSEAMELARTEAAELVGRYSGDWTIELQAAA